MLRVILRYETSGGADGASSAQQVIYGRNLRDGSDSFTGFDRVQFVPEENVFGDDGVTESIDTRFGVTGENLKLSATFGYSLQSERFNGIVQLRWTPFKPAPATN